jgi:hypothetical protein
VKSISEKRGKKRRRVKLLQSLSENEKQEKEGEKQERRRNQ